MLSDFILKEKYITNEKVCKIIKNLDTSKVSRIFKKWVEQGLLIKIDAGAKKTIKYRLPIDEEREYLFANYNANKNQTFNFKCFTDILCANL